MSSKVAVVCRDARSDNWYSRCSLILARVLREKGCEVHFMGEVLPAGRLAQDGVEAHVIAPGPLGWFYNRRLKAELTYEPFDCVIGGPEVPLAQVCMLERHDQAPGWIGEARRVMVPDGETARAVFQRFNLHASKVLAVGAAEAGLRSGLAACALSLLENK